MGYIIEQIYKPQRLLYYIVPTMQQREDFYKGILPDALMEYNGSFGTYDNPGLFLVNYEDYKGEVLGIEFRPNDERINYPSDLLSMDLKPGFMISALFTDEGLADETTINSVIPTIRQTAIRPSLHGDIRPTQKSEIVQIFNCNKRNRIYLQAEIVPGTSPQTIDPETDRENLLHYGVYHDFITGHYNWNHIWPIVAGYGLHGIQDFVFVHFDVKDFNALNVVYGHEVANSVLCRIAEHSKKFDWIYHSARCHNDNFAMMLKDMPQEELTEKLRTFFDEISILPEDPKYRIYYRCGVVPMRNCLLLSDRVADAGKNVQKMGTKSYETEILFYTDKMFEELAWASRIKAYLPTAIENDEFLVYLQPKYDIYTEQIIGAEALIRWNYQHQNLISPGRFVPIFETGGLIGKLDDIVLQKVCESLSNWKKRGLKLYPISVNLSRTRLGQPNLVEHLTSIVDRYDVDHSLIDFELTESAVYENQEYMIKVINHLKSQGFKLSLDDFGTGYSSLALLTILPIDTIKIDKSFVDRIGLVGTTEEDRFKDSTVIKHMIEMSRELHFKCLAEGAEALEQVVCLRNFGCEAIQGYYYSKPLPTDEYEAKLI